MMASACAVLIAIMMFGTPAFGQTKIGPEFRVNTSPTEIAYSPHVASLLDGGFLVTWTSYNGDGSGYGVFAQRYSATGARIGTEFQVNTYTQGNQHNSSAIGLPNGGFVVVWTSDDQENLTNPGIYAQRFRPNGTKEGTEIHVNTNAAYNQIDPSITLFGDSRFVVAWTTIGQEGHDIFGQRFNNIGKPMAHEYRLNSIVGGRHRTPKLANLGDGGFIAAWSLYTENSPGWIIYTRRFDPFGRPLGPDSRVNANNITSNGGNGVEVLELAPSVAGLLDGGYVLAWSTSQNLPGPISLKRFDKNGKLLSTPVGAYGSGQAISKLSDGGFILVWQGIKAKWDIFGQRYSANGSPAGDKFQINTYTPRDQRYPSVTNLKNGGFIVVWRDYRGGIYGQRFAS